MSASATQGGHKKFVWNGARERDRERETLKWNWH